MEKCVSEKQVGLSVKTYALITAGVMGGAELGAGGSVNRMFYGMCVLSKVAL